ncbi:MAG: KH domain-containing protein [Cyanobacteria bacterium REEB65]|nr:KH domain-containing protein [Cyanobacteria bacterium REEB65]
MSEVSASEFISADLTAPQAESVESARLWLKALLAGIGLPLEVTTRPDVETVVFMLEAPEDAGALIGRKGQTLDALQYLTNVAFSQKVGRRLTLDVAEYRQRHLAKLVEQAQAAALRVRTTGRSLRLPPMNAADRRVIHTSVLDFPDLVTASHGEEPFRCVIVEPKDRRFKPLPQRPPGRPGFGGGFRGGRGPGGGGGGFRRSGGPGGSGAAGGGFGRPQGSGLNGPSGGSGRGPERPPTGGGGFRSPRNSPTR